MQMTAAMAHVTSWSSLDELACSPGCIASKVSGLRQMFLVLNSRNHSCHLQQQLPPFRHISTSYRRSMAPTHLPRWSKTQLLHQACDSLGHSFSHDTICSEVSPCCLLMPEESSPENLAGAEVAWLFLENGMETPRLWQGFRTPRGPDPTAREAQKLQVNVWQ